MWAIIKFFLFLFMPYLITKGLGLLVGQKSKKRQGPKEEATAWSKAVRAAAFSFILWNGYCAIVWQQPNLFHRYGLSLDSAGFEMRRVFKQYVSEEASQSAAFAEMLQQRQRHVNDELEGVRSERETFTGHPELEVPYVRVRNLMARLKSKELRAVYVKFGEKALTGCDYCADDLDYFLFILPDVLAGYVGYAVLLGLLTALRSKRRWLPLGLVALAVLLAVEVLVHFGTNLVQPDLYDLFFPRAAPNALRYQKMDFVRRFFLVCFTAIALLFSNGGEEDLSDRINALGKAAAGILNKSHATRLQRAAVLQDAELRKQHMEHYRHKELQRVLHSASAEYQAHQRELLHRYDLDSLVREATEFVDGAFEGGKSGKTGKE
jgi:hypothetical protein